MAEYSLSLAEAWAFPLEGYLALLPAMITRHGGQVSGPQSSDQASIAARAKAKDWLASHFRILPIGTPGPQNALQRWLADRGAEVRNAADPLTEPS